MTYDQHFILFQEVFKRLPFQCLKTSDHVMGLPFKQDVFDYMVKGKKYSIDLENKPLCHSFSLEAASVDILCVT